jgi:hypothetical protein
VGVYGFCTAGSVCIEISCLTPNAPGLTALIVPQGFDAVLSDMLHFTSGVNDVELSLELAGTALHIATGYHFDLYGDAYVERTGFRHAGFLRPGGSLVMKVYEVRVLLRLCGGSGWGSCANAPPGTLVLKVCCMHVRPRGGRAHTCTASCRHSARWNAQPHTVAAGSRWHLLRGYGGRES